MIPATNAGTGADYPYMLIYIHIVKVGAVRSEGGGDYVGLDLGSGNGGTFVVAEVTYEPEVERERCVGSRSQIENGGVEVLLLESDGSVSDGGSKLHAFLRSGRSQVEIVSHWRGDTESGRIVSCRKVFSIGCKCDTGNLSKHLGLGFIRIEHCQILLDTGAESSCCEKGHCNRIYLFHLYAV